MNLLIINDDKLYRDFRIHAHWLYVYLLLFLLLYGSLLSFVKIDTRAGSVDRACNAIRILVNVPVIVIHIRIKLLNVFYMYELSRHDFSLTVDEHLFGILTPSGNDLF